jgi:hypothetical protein
VDDPGGTDRGARSADGHVADPVAVDVGAAGERGAEVALLHLALVRGDELLASSDVSEERADERRGDDSSGHRSSSFARTPASRAASQ